MFRWDKNGLNCALRGDFLRGGHLPPLAGTAAQGALSEPPTPGQPARLVSSAACRGRSGPSGTGCVLNKGLRAARELQTQLCSKGEQTTDHAVAARGHF